MPRRGENIHKRKDGRWEARYIDYYTDSGKAHYKSLYAYSYGEVRAKLKNASVGIKEEVHIEKHITMESLSGAWLDSIRIKVKESTYALYDTVLKTHINPYFGSKAVKELDSDSINEFIKYKSAKGRLDGKGGLSSKTVCDIYRLLEQILNYGRDRNYIDRTFISPTLPREDFKELEVFNIFEISRLVSYTSTDLDIGKFGVLLTLYTGLRLGELCALKWSDIDMDSNLIRITKTLQRVKVTDGLSETKTRIIIDAPKSKKSIRDIPIPERLKETLEQYGEIFARSGYLLTGDYKYMEPRTYQFKYKRYLLEAGLPPKSFHTLRHTFATYATEAGFETKSLSEILGHATVKFTLDRYVHSTDRLKREGMEKLANFY